MYSLLPWQQLLSFFTILKLTVKRLTVFRLSLSTPHCYFHIFVTALSLIFYELFHKPSSRPISSSFFLYFFSIIVVIHKSFFIMMCPIHSVFFSLIIFNIVNYILLIHVLPRLTLFVRRIFNDFLWYCVLKASIFFLHARNIVCFPVPQTATFNPKLIFVSGFLKAKSCWS